MLGEIVVMSLLVVGIVLFVYLITSGNAIPGNLPVVKSKIPMPKVKPTFDPWKAPQAPKDPVYGQSSPHRTGIINSSTRRTSYPSGGGTSTGHDTQSSDLLSTLLILDALDTSDNYVEPSVDRYVEPSYSSPTPSSYSDTSSSYSSSSSSYDDSSSRSSSYSSSSYSSSDSSSSYDSGSSSSSSYSSD